MESEYLTQTAAAVPPLAMITARMPGLGSPADGLAATSGLSPEVRKGAPGAKPAPGECSSKQLVEIVLGVARQFRAAKDAISGHREYILRLKAEVFKVRFGSAGIRVRISWIDENGCTVSRRLLWKEFCEAFFLVSEDWISRVCGGKADRRGKSKAACSQEAPAAEADWKAVLVRLVFELGQCGDLPKRASAAVDVAKAALEGRQREPARAKAPVQEDRRPPARPAGGKAGNAPARRPTISYPGGKARLAPVLAALMPQAGGALYRAFCRTRQCLLDRRFQRASI